MIRINHWYWRAYTRELVTEHLMETDWENEWVHYSLTK